MRSSPRRHRRRLPPKNAIRKARSTLVVRRYGFSLPAPQVTSVLPLNCHGSVGPARRQRPHACIPARPGSRERSCICSKFAQHKHGKASMCLTSVYVSSPTHWAEEMTGDRLPFPVLAELSYRKQRANNIHKSGSVGTPEMRSPEASETTG